MPFIGAGIQAVKGFAETILNKKKLKQLASLDQADLFELIPEEKHLSAKILLKQTEHQSLIFNNASRQALGNIEKEILVLMKENIEQKKEELQKKEATQLDIANLLLTIQKLSHETIEEHHSFKNIVNKEIVKYRKLTVKFVTYFIIYNVILTCLVLYFILKV